MWSRTALGVSRPTPRADWEPRSQAGRACAMSSGALSSASPNASQQGPLLESGEEEEADVGDGRRGEQEEEGGGEHVDLTERIGERRAPFAANRRCEHELQRGLRRARHRWQQRAWDGKRARHGGGATSAAERVQSRRVCSALGLRLGCEVEARLLFRRASLAQVRSAHMRSQRCALAEQAAAAKGSRKRAARVAKATRCAL